MEALESPTSDGELLQVKQVEDLDSNNARRKGFRFMKFLPRTSLSAKEGHYDLKRSSGLSSSSEDGEMAPKDHFNLVYIGMIVSGVGFLLPWSCYTAAIDYFFFYYLEDFPTVSVAIPMSYLVPTLLAASLNIVLVRTVGTHPRITFGHVMFFIGLLVVPLLDIGINNCTISTNVSYYITLIVISMVGLGSGVQQSSFYGLATMLPRKYSQAVMAGESVAGFMGSLFRIITKLAFQSERAGSIFFFALSASFIVVCVLSHCYIRKNKMVNFYARKCQNKLEKEEESFDERVLLSNMEMEDLSLQTETEDEASDVIGAMETVPGNQQEKEEGRNAGFNTTQQKLSSNERLRAVKRVVVQIWPLIGSIFTTYFVTLLLFPGLLSEVQNCSLGSWTPVIIIAIFNFIDLVVKWLALINLRWRPKQLLVAAAGRVILIPLVLLCVAPSPTHPILGANVVVWAGLFTLVLGGTNGYFGSLSMISISAHVKDNKDRELAGSLMTWVLFVGLFMGAVCAYALTPLTTIGDHIDCINSTILFFDLCANNSATPSL